MSHSSTVSALVDSLLDLPSPAPRVEEIGQFTQLNGGVALVGGLPHALVNEVIETSGGLKGVVLDLSTGGLGIALLGPAESALIGQPVYRTREVLSVPVGPSLLGRIVDALGAPKDDLGPIDSACSPMEADAPAILERSQVMRPLATGLTVVDAAVPIGRGQRQLIVGDRQTGKTSVALDAILNQSDSGVLCVYCAIGQRHDAVARVIATLRSRSAMHRCTVVVAGDEEVPGLAYCAPYTAMTIAESLAADGSDVLVVFDDLTHHARAYRELSLLLRRPPGREAFPGDIFYVHARLLERAGQFSRSYGGGSITALPIVETQAEDLSAYIPTNLISITDGQLYLSPRLVQKNQFPAVDLGVSVSRVGSKAQSAAFRAIASNLRVTLSQFEELEEFARFGTRLDTATRARLDRGKAVRAVLRQAEHQPRSSLAQLIMLTGALNGLYDAWDAARLTSLYSRLLESMDNSETQALARRLEQDTDLDEDDRQQLLSLAAAARTLEPIGSGQGPAHDSLAEQSPTP